MSRKETPEPIARVISTACGCVQILHARGIYSLRIAFPASRDGSALNQSALNVEPHRGRGLLSPDHRACSCEPHVADCVVEREVEGDLRRPASWCDRPQDALDL